MTWLAILIIVAVVWVFSSFIMWMLGVAADLLMLAVKIGALILLFMFIVYGIKVMSKKVDS